MMGPASTPPNEVRINARLSGDDAALFQKLLQITGLSASELLRTALREYYAAQQPPPAHPLELLQNFIGSGEGPENLSISYKERLSQLLENKLSSYVQESRAPYG